MNLPIGPNDGVRDHPRNWTHAPEKAKTHCFYCKCAVPNHAEDCIVPSRTVVVEFTTRMVISMPQSFDESSINFSMNGSSACSSRYVDQLYRETNQEENICHICSRTEMKYLREATQEDHENLSYIEENKGII